MTVFENEGILHRRDIGSLQYLKKKYLKMRVFENDMDLALSSIYADPPTADVQPGFIPSINLALNTTISECENIWISFIYLALNKTITECENIWIFFIYWALNTTTSECENIWI